MSKETNRQTDKQPVTSTLCQLAAASESEKTITRTDKLTNKL